MSDHETKVQDRVKVEAATEQTPTTAESPAPATTVAAEKEAVTTEAVVKVKADDNKEADSIPAAAAEADTKVKAPAADSKTETKEETPAAAASTDSSKVKAEENEDEKPGAMIKTKARLDKTNFKKNVKYDPQVLPGTADPDKIRTQVEFYFSDSNLPIDKFMWNLTGGPENKSVPVKTIATFGRMKRFQPYESVIAALKECESLVLEGEAGEETIKRKVGYSSEGRENHQAKSAYVKGFGDEKASTQFDLEAFFTKYGTVTSVRLRRTPERLFKGSVFVEFSDVETQKKFLELDPKPTWEDHELLIMGKTEYIQDKCRQIREGTLKPSTKPSFFEGREKNTNKDAHGSKKPNDRNGKGNKFSGRGRGGRGGKFGGRGGGRGGRGGHSKPRTPAIDVDAVALQEQDAKDRLAKEKAQSEKAQGVKREREEDGSAAEPAAKKVDVKAQVSTEA